MRVATKSLQKEKLHIHVRFVITVDEFPKMTFPVEKYSYPEKCNTGVCPPLSWLVEQFRASSVWSHDTTYPGTTP